MKAEQLIDFLKEVPLLCNLEDYELRQLSDVSIVKEFDRNKIIFYEQDQGTNLYIIVYGQVKIVVNSNDGREHILGFLKDKDFFGEISLLDGEPRSSSVISLEKAKVIIINRHDFLKVLRNNPDITYKIILSLCTKLRWTDRHVSNLAFLSASGRVAKTIIELAEKENIIENNEYIVNHKMTRQDFANIAGTSRETLTRIIMEFQEEKILSSFRNKIIIHNKKLLLDKVI
jgi:CRP/FNR family cyclic AMP-dependent transcriptional regulator